jgi:hypothetical protein
MRQKGSGRFFGRHAGLAEENIHQQPKSLTGRVDQKSRACQYQDKLLDFAKFDFQEQ